jgi:hypothetical protein
MPITLTTFDLVGRSIFISNSYLISTKSEELPKRLQQNEQLGPYNDRRPLDNFLKEQLLVLYNGECAICHYSTIIETHHIIPVHKGGLTIITNLITLCPNHHREAERGMISDLHLFELTQKAYYDNWGLRLSAVDAKQFQFDLIRTNAYLQMF